MTKDIEELTPRVFEKAPQCPEPTAIRHLRDAAIEFCERTRIWRFHDSFAVQVSDCEEISAPQDAVVFEISAATFNGEPLEAVTMDWLDDNRPKWRDEEECDRPLYITQSVPGTLRVVPAAAGMLALELILKPAQDAETIPDVLWEHGRAIANGALSTLLKIPGDFGNPALAGDCDRLWNDKLDELAARLPKGQQRAPRRARADSQF